MVPTSRFGFAVLFLIAAVAGIYFFVRPAVATLQETKRAHVLAQAKLEYESSVADAYAALAVAVKANADDLALIEKALPLRAQKPTTTPEFLVGIRDIAEVEAGGVFLRTFGVRDSDGGAASEEGQGAGVRPQNLTMTGIASYDGFKRFLHALALSRRIIDPQSIVLSSATEDGSVINFQVIADTYTYQP